MGRCHSFHTREVWGPRRSIAGIYGSYRSIAIDQHSCGDGGLPDYDEDAGPGQRRITKGLMALKLCEEIATPWRRSTQEKQRNGDVSTGRCT